MELDNVDDILPLTPTQSGILFHSIASESNRTSYNGQVIVELDGNIDLNRLEASWNKMIERYSALRTVFIWDGLDEPLQVVRSEIEQKLEYFDLSAETTSAQQQWISEFTDKDLATPFDLSKAPIMRLTLIFQGDGQYTLIWALNHGLCDGWSVSVLLRNLLLDYNEGSGESIVKPTTVFPYNRYIAWLQNLDHAKSERYWRDRLQGFRQPTQLQSNSKFDKKTENSVQSSQIISIDQNLSDGVRTLARAAEVSQFVVFQAVFALLLHRYSGNEDIVFGVTTSGRTEDLAGINDAVGMFFNTLPVRFLVSGKYSFHSWLKHLQAEFHQFKKHEYTPLLKVQEWSDIESGSSLFDAILVYENYPHLSQDDCLSGDLKIKEVQARSNSNYGLSLLVYPGEQIKLKFVYSHTHYDDTFINRLLKQTEQIIRAVVNKPNTRLTEIPIYSIQEQSEIKGWVSGQELSSEKETILDLLSGQISDQPDRCAVLFGEYKVSYGQLDRLSNYNAQRLANLGVSRGDKVAISLPPGIDQIIAILSVLKAGAAYIPVDPSYPAKRLEFIVNDSQVRVAIANADTKKVFSEEIAVLNLDMSESVNCGNFCVDLRPEDPAYVIYTSGSTGVPKGVQVSHKNLLASTLSRIDYYQDNPETFLLLSSYSFDSSVAGIFWTLSTGGVLQLVPSKMEQDVEFVSQLITVSKTTHTLLLPSLYQVFLTEIPEAVKQLHCVILAGETLLGETVQEHRRVAQDTKLFNEYGPTEATVWSTAFDTDDWDEIGPVPIGRPIPGAHVFVLDTNGRIPPPGVMGEIHIAGDTVVNGYLKNSALTKENFILRDTILGRSMTLYRTGDVAYYNHDGNIIFSGRIDQQVKVRGYRIEVAEIESALLKLSGVKAAHIVHSPKQNRVPETIDETLTDDEIIRQLSQLDNQEAHDLLDEVMNNEL